MTHLAFLSFAWPFLHPGLAGAAVIAASIPLLIHLINRKRFQKMPWAAMAFLLAANRRSARRIRLESLVLLFLRTSLIVMLGIGLARPFLSSSRASNLGLGNAGVHRIILLDNSLSMQAARLDGQSRFGAGIGIAQKLLNLFPQGDGISLITTAQPGEVIIGDALHDRRAVREILSNIKPTQKADDVVGALEVTKNVLRASSAPPNNRVVYLISDFTYQTWHAQIGQPPSPAIQKLSELADVLGHDPSRLNLVRVEPGTCDNLTVTAFRPESALVSTQIPITFVIDISNFGAATVTGAMLQLRDGSQTIRRESLPVLEPGASTSAAVSVQFSSPGNQLLEARVTSGASDSLPADDARWLSLKLRQEVPVLIVDGQPGAQPMAGQAGYLATALSPHKDSRLGPSAGWARVSPNFCDAKVISPLELEQEISSSYDVIALCNVRDLRAEEWEALDRFAKGGGGVFTALGPFVSKDNYNYYGFAGGEGLLPAQLEAIQENSAHDERVGFALGSETHGLFGDFVGHPSSGLFSARVNQYFRLSSLPPGVQIPLRFSDQEPALVIHQRGEGKVALWTTSVNMDWNNLPARGDFVAVMLEVIARLVPEAGQHRNLLVGQSVVESLTPAESSMPLKVVWGEQQMSQPQIVPAGNGLAVQFGPALSAGPLTLHIGAERRGFSINTDVSESALQSVDPSILSSFTGKNVQWVSENDLPVPSPAQSVELASALLWFVLGLLLLELWAAQRFSAPHPAEALSSVTSRHVVRNRFPLMPGTARS